MQKAIIAAVAAMGKNRVLGRENMLLWQIPEDLRRFKELTKGHPVIMGRKTFESIVGYLGGPLPKRFNIVVTRDKNWKYDGIIAVGSVEDAIEEAKKLDKYIFIGGGAQIYEAALPYTDKLYLTLIDDEKEGDSFFPAYEKIFTHIAREESHEWNGLKYHWVDLDRK